MATIAERQQADERRRKRLRRLQAVETAGLIGSQAADRLRAVLAITDEEWEEAQAKDVGDGA